MKNKLLKKTTLEKLLIIFMIIQPILDIYYLYTDKIINIFKLSPSTIIRMIFMGILIILSYLNLKNKNKFKWLISLVVVYITYTVFHHLNAIDFNNQLKVYDNYNLVRELFYIIRMIMPLGMIFITKNTELKEDKIKKIIYTVINIFCITIIITNIAKISLTSYSDGNKIIVANFFEWFNKDIYQKYSYELIASKGIFHMANQISAVLLALFPIELYFFLTKKTTISKILTLITSILAMLMLGTRVASYGWIIAIILVLAQYIYFGIIKKQKIAISKIIIILSISIAFCLILPYSPVNNRTYANDLDGNIQEKIKQSEGEIERKNLCQDNTEKCQQDRINYIEKYYEIYGFDTKYIKDNYSYKEDPEFWIESFDIPYTERANHRQLKTMITKRLINLNDNKLDYLLGISFTRLRNTQVYMENDIYVHMYSIGILGIIIFIIPFLSVAIYALYKMIKNKNLTFINTIYLSSIAIVFLAGMVSGNVFDEWIVTLFLGFICGLLLKNINIKE